MTLFQQDMLRHRRAPPGCSQHKHSIWGSPANTRSGPTVLNFIDLGEGGGVLPPRQAVARPWGRHTTPAIEPQHRGGGRREGTRPSSLQDEELYSGFLSPATGAVNNAGGVRADVWRQERRSQQVGRCVEAIQALAEKPRCCTETIVAPPISSVCAMTAISQPPCTLQQTALAPSTAELLADPCLT